jgi:septum site-determining protein MinD
MLSVEDVQEILAIPLLGVIPESASVLQASNTGIPVILEPKSDAGLAYGDAVQRFLGTDLPHRHREQERRGLLGRLFAS